MNTPITLKELDAGERRRRAAAQAKAEALARKLGFRESKVDGKWWHEDLGDRCLLDFTSANDPVETVGDLVVRIYAAGLADGKREVRSLLRSAIGL